MRTRRMAGLGVVAGLLIALLTTPAAIATTGNGPPLDVPPPTLQQSLSCTGDLATAATPVLLVPGTTLTPREDFSWNYVRAFTAAHRPFCTVTLPNHAMSDIQVSAEYVVAAIRTMQQRAHRKIDIIGHSQGGMIFRWALKYWPDTRGDVADVVGLAPSNHGTLDANGLCSLPGGCAPSIWQQRTDAAFIRALNAGGETYPGIDYTVAYTETDEVVVPNLRTPPGLPPDAVVGPSSALAGGANVANLSLQQICPGHPADHLTTGTSDAVAYAIALDALDHPGPASAARIARSVCLQPFQPGVDPAAFPVNFANVVAVAGQQVATYPHVPAEPPLKPYARSQ